MSDHDADPVLQRAVVELRRLPELNRAAVQRIADAAAAARLSAADDEVGVRRSSRWRLTIGLAAAAAVVGFVARGFIASGRAPATPVATSLPTMAEAPVRPAAASGTDVMLIPQQFVLENANARSVSVVGDFNNWNPKATPLTRSSDGGLWSAIVPLAPGRHVYGFMVNDSTFVLDPQRPKVRDPDFGTDASVTMVGRP